MRSRDWGEYVEQPVICEVGEAVETESKVERSHERRNEPDESES
jgi:hypothetical protein